MIGWLKTIAGLFLAALRYLNDKRLLDAGRDRANAKALEDSAKREGRGRDAVAKEVDQTAGADQRDLIKRLRARYGDWQ